MLTHRRLKDKVTPYAKHMQAISQPWRMAIVFLLAHDPMEVGDITDALGIPENLVAHHLKQMHDTGWLSKIKQGRNVTYQLNEKAFFELRRLLGDTPFGRRVFTK